MKREAWSIPEISHSLGEHRLIRKGAVGEKKKEKERLKNHRKASIVLIVIVMIKMMFCK